MVRTITRGIFLALPWLALMAVSISVAYAMGTSMAGGVSAAAPGDGSLSSVAARTVGGDAPLTGDASYTGVGTTYISPGCWLPDPSGLEPCANETTSG